MLINNGVNVNVADENRNTAMHLAVEEGIDCVFNTFLLTIFIKQVNSFIISSRASENSRIIE